jgi:YfiH family protein
MITDIPGYCLIIRSADCVPVILIDPIRKAVGAVHSGWRGSVLGIAGKTVTEMKTVFAGDPREIHAYIFPSIGPSSYQVSKDVAEKFPGCFIVTESGYYLDLWKSVEQSLEGAGVKPENIFNNRLCTLSNNDRFFSHRGGDAGRMINFVFMPELD